jgi:poly(3-hydroxybutyrate) depolymerase
MQYEGRDVIIREGVGTNCPLVIALHGSLGNPTTFQSNIDLESILSDNVTICYPASGGTTWFAGGENGQDNDDILYLSGLIYHLQNNYNVDENKIYILGYSNGGMMAYRAASEIEDTFAGVVGISATITNYAEFEYNKKLLHIHGMDDATLPIAGNATYDPLLTIFNAVQDKLSSLSIEFVGNSGHQIAELKANDLYFNDRIKRFIEG